MIRNNNIRRIPALVLKHQGRLDYTELTVDVERQLPDDSAQQTGCLFILILNIKTANIFFFLLY